MSQPRILIVEDEESLRIGLSETMGLEGFSVQACPRGDTALAAVDQFKPDLMLLDLMLPGLHGMEVCKRLRAKGATLPIIMLTALADETQIVEGLKAGADDYITKPFRLAELHARVAAQLRRVQSTFNAPLNLPACKVDLTRGEVTRDGQAAPLTQLEVELIKYLLKARPSAVTRDELLVKVWGYKEAVATRTVDMAVAKLRAKIEQDKEKPRVIVTVRDAGYRWEL